MDALAYFSCSVVKGVTLGVVNLNPMTDQIVIKDPITGTADIFKNASDVIFRDERKDVWIGSRTINNSVGVSSAILRTFNLDIMHQAVMVDGVAYSLTNDKDSTIQIKPTTSHDKSKYDWRYRGKRCTYYKIDDLVEAANKLSISYSLAFANCQDVSDSLSKYALGIYTKSDALYFIFPTINTLPDVVLHSLFAGTGAKAYVRLMGDILTVVC